MTFNKIYIGAFGSLKDFTLELDRGLNVIFGENENGKSTIMAFIKMMFYGSGRKAQQISKNPRQKYLPWNGDTMGGRVYFEHSGHRYCLEREFKKSDATDRITLRDLDLGTSESAPSDIGKRFFELGEQAFERSVFIGSAPSEADETASGELNSRLSNIASTGDETTSYQTVSKRISDAVGELVTQRHVGVYDKGLVRLEELKKELSVADEAAKRRNALSDKIKQLGSQLSDTKAQYLKLKETVDSENDIRHAEKLREYLETKKELDALNQKLLLDDGGQIDTMFISKVNFCLSKLETECTRVQEKKEQYLELEATIKATEDGRDRATPQRLEEIKQSISQLQSIEVDLKERCEQSEQKIMQKNTELEFSRTKKKAFEPILLIIGIIALAFVPIFLFAVPNSFIATVSSAVVGAVLTALSFIIRPIDKAASHRIESELLDIKKELNDLQTQQATLIGKINSNVSEMNIIAAALNTDKALLEQKKNDLSVLAEQLNTAEQQRQSAADELTAIYSRYETFVSPEQAKEALSKLTEHTEQQKSIKLRLKYLSQDLGNISYETAEQKLATVNNRDDTDSIDFEALKKQLDDVNEKGINLSNELSSAMTELKTELKNATCPETLQQEINTLAATLDEQKQFIDAARLAESVLEDSFAEVRRSYGSELEKRTLELFSKITGGRYSRVNVSKTMELETEASGDFTSHSIEYLSSGTIDQAYLSLRLAVAELITGDERLPILLDDSLSQYDDTRAATALGYLKEYADSSQTVLFTCHNSICNTAKELGVDIKRL